MPAIRQVPRAELTNATMLAYFERLFGPDRDPITDPGTATGSPGNWWSVFANSEEVFEHAVNGFKLYRSPKIHLNPVLRELGQTRVGWTIGSQFVFSQHCKLLRALGVSDDKIKAVPAWQVSDLFNDQERAILAYADCLSTGRGRTPVEVMTKLKTFLSDEEILEFTYIVSMYVMHAIMSRALKTEFDDRPEAIVEVDAPEGFSTADFLSSRPADQR